MIFFFFLFFLPPCSVVRVASDGVVAMFMHGVWNKSYVGAWKMDCMCPKCVRSVEKWLMMVIFAEAVRICSPGLFFCFLLPYSEVGCD